MGDLIGYMRVSTTEQDLESQRHRLSEAGAVKIFKDVISGKNFERPGLSALLDYARSGDTIIVVRLDRLGRSLQQLLETIEQLKQRAINFKSLEEKLDTSSAAGELVFHIFGSIAHFERRLISERTKDGISAAKARGKLPGRPSLPSEKKDAALALIAAGLSPSRAAEQLGIGRSTIYRELADSKENN